MLLMATNSLNPGMELARPVYDTGGALLLQAGVRLAEPHIRRLQSRGVVAVYVRVPGLEDVEVTEPVAGATRAELQQAVSAALADAAAASQLRVERLGKVVRAAVEEVLASPQAICALAEVRAVETAATQHAAAVMVTSLVMARRLGLSGAQLVELGVGVLLHDVGKSRLPPVLLQPRPGPLAPDEWDAFRRHCEEGFNLLRTVPGFSLLSAHVAFQHHERMDGSGYPRGLRGEEIHTYAKICMVADEYDDLVTGHQGDRPHPPAEALALLQERAGGQLDPVVIRALLHTVAPYPVATLVELSTGEIGIVRQVEAGHLAEPVVRVFRGPKGGRIEPPRDVNLARTPGVTVRRALTQDRQIVS